MRLRSFIPQVSPWMKMGGEGVKGWRGVRGWREWGDEGSEGVKGGEGVKGVEEVKRRDGVGNRFGLPYRLLFEGEKSSQWEWVTFSMTYNTNHWQKNNN